MNSEDLAAAPVNFLFVRLISGSEDFYSFGLCACFLSEQAKGQC